MKLGERQEADAQAQEARRAASLKEVRQVGSGEGGGSSESLSAALDEIVTSGGKRLAEKIAATHPQPAAHVVGGSSNGSLALHSLVGTGVGTGVGHGTGAGVGHGTGRSPPSAPRSRRPSP